MNSWDSGLIFSNRYLLILIGALIAIFPLTSGPLAIVLGFTCTLLFPKICSNHVDNLSSFLLKISVVLLGFGMNWSELVTYSVEGFRLTAFSVVITLLLGLLLGYIIKTEKKTTWLIAAGTAICGGSAIATVSPIINAKGEQFSYALIVIFVLNALALLLFPIVGKGLALSEEVFGNWAAIAIHDTSSVVGAGEAFGNQALRIATMVKLTRALWIIPLALLFILLESKKGWRNIKIPWFILGFVASIFLTKIFSGFQSEFQVLDNLGRKGMLLTLFLIGASIKIREIRKAGVKPFILGISLWLLVSVGALMVVERVFQ